MDRSRMGKSRLEETDCFSLILVDVPPLRKVAGKDGWEPNDGLPCNISRVVCGLYNDKVDVFQRTQEQIYFTHVSTHRDQRYIHLYLRNRNQVPYLSMF